MIRAFRRLGQQIFSSLNSKTIDGFDAFRLLTETNGSDKWHGHNYAEAYYRHFRDLKEKPICLLEIGVGGYQDDVTGYGNPALGGDSLRFWKTFFDKGRIYAIDIEDKSVHQEDRITIFQGSQTDTAFLSRVIQTIGPLDIIIDDGSHINSHVITSFELLFPHLKDGGIYVVEDTQTSYWPDGYGGDPVNRSNPKTIMGYFKNYIDGLNHAEFPEPDYKPSYFDLNIRSISFYHNMIFLNKGANDCPSNVLGR
jgi:hypothetical protein